MCPKPAENEPPHQTFNVGVKALIVRNNRALLLKRRDHNRWEIPGGRINPGEDARKTLRRELQEELPGIAHIRVGQLLCAEQTDFLLPNGNRLMLLIFRVHADMPSPITISEEHSEARWVSPGAIGPLNPPLPVLKAAKRALRHEL